MNPPQFAENLDTELSIPEDTPVGQDIGNALTATDPDTGDTVAYFVSGTDSDLFEVDSNGQLQVKEALDFESKPSVTVIVSVTDSEDVAGNADTTADDTHTVTITVTNVFEAPRFNDDDGNGTATRAIPENTEANQNVGLPIAATDDERDTLTYSITGTDAASFEFETATGQIKTKDALNHETREFYSVIVEVTDGKAVDGTTAETTIDTTIVVTIAVEDINEKPTFDPNAVTDLSIAENTAADTPIGAAFTASDEDENEALTYGLTGTDAASFDIDTATGQIKTKADLDHEIKATYSITVTVSDGRRNNAGADEQTPVADTTIAVTITVTDADEPGTITLPINPPSAGTPVTAVLEDEDGIKTDVDVTWVWETSSDKTNWTPIDGATTDTYIPQEDDIDDYLRVTATYDDEFGAGKTAEAETVAVLALPATNLQPSFADATATRTVQENTAADVNIGEPVGAAHPDSVGTLVYTLDTTGAATFDIDSATGQLKTRSTWTMKPRRATP